MFFFSNYESLYQCRIWVILGNITKFPPQILEDNFPEINAYAEVAPFCLVFIKCKLKPEKHYTVYSVRD